MNEPNKMPIWASVIIAVPYTLSMFIYLFLGLALFAMIIIDESLMETAFVCAMFVPGYVVCSSIEKITRAIIRR